MWDSDDVDNCFFFVYMDYMIYFIYFDFAFFVRSDESIVVVIFSDPSHLVAPGYFVFVLFPFFCEIISIMTNIAVGIIVCNNLVCILGPILIAAVQTIMVCTQPALVVLSIFLSLLDYHIFEYFLDSFHFLNHQRIF